jgi:hypothetical protein
VRAKTKILEDRFIVTITGRSLEGIGFAVQDNRGVPAFGWRLLTSASLEELTAFVKRTCRLIPERPALVRIGRSIRFDAKMIEPTLAKAHAGNKGSIANSKMERFPEPNNR